MLCILCEDIFSQERDHLQQEDLEPLKESADLQLAYASDRLSFRSKTSPRLGLRGHIINGLRTGLEILRSSATCELCKLIWDSMVQRRELDDYTLIDVEIEILGQDVDHNPEVIYLTLHGRDGGLLGYRSLDLIPAEHAETKIGGFNSPVTSSQDTWEMITNNLSHCLSHHLYCREDVSVGWLPTRLIYLGLPLSHDVPRIVESAQILRDSAAKDIKYVALSHKWGKSKLITLSMAKLESFKKQIPSAGLSRTFLEAIEVSRRMQIQYIWIDSLCIIQDSLEDWRNESSMMGLVYKNCVCNIAASDAESSEQGLFRTRDIDLLKPVKVQFNTTSLQRKYWCFYDGWDDLECEAPLNKRGWVIQERLLSPRTLHFSSQVFWECREHRACENYPLGPPTRRIVVQGKIWSDLQITEGKINPLCRWENAIEVYTGCSLTKTEDKLIAISGIAKSFRYLLQDGYLSGIWSNHIIRGLLWGVHKDLNGEDKDARRPKSYRAPSWSWASIDGEIYPWLAETIEHSLIHVLEAKTTPIAHDPYGQVIDGHIDILARIFNIPDIDDVLKDRWEKKEFDSWSFGLDEWQDLDGPIVYIPLAQVSSKTAQKFSIYGLLLRAIDTTIGPPAYKRLGFAALSLRGDIAGTGYICPGWHPPPWLPDTISKIRLV